MVLFVDYICFVIRRVGDFLFFGFSICWIFGFLDFRVLRSWYMKHRVPMIYNPTEQNAIVVHHYKRREAHT